MLSIPLTILLSPFSDLPSPWDGPTSPVDVLYNDKRHIKIRSRPLLWLFVVSMRDRFCCICSGNAPPKGYPRAHPHHPFLLPPSMMMFCAISCLCDLCVHGPLYCDLPHNMHVSMETEECIDRIENRAKTKKVHGIKRITLCKQYMGMLGGTEGWKKGKRKKIVHRSYNSFYFCGRVTME